MKSEELQKELRAIRELQRRNEANYRANQKKIEARLLTLEKITQENEKGEVEVSDEMQLLLKKAMIRRGIPIEKLSAVTESCLTKYNKI